jgi:phenylacetate-coenzyme A ligase PaaK-like adenylate-forming protein
MLARLAAEQRADRLKISPVAVTTSGETAQPELRDAITQAFGVPVTDTFASSEGLVGTTAPADDLFVFNTDLCIVEVVDADNRPVPPGKPGAKVLVTNLENRTLPLIRYELADRVTESPDPNPAGRPYRHLAGIDGRTADTLSFPAAGGGSVALLPLRIGAPFARLPEVRQFQVVHERGRLEVRVVLDPAAPGDIPDRVRSAVIRMLLEAGAVPPDVVVTRVSELEREAGPAAKLKLIVSRT